jgi:RimJ/RimL family protein N-acetyltransferase
VEFLVQPSARNPRAIRAYEKAGFRPAGGTRELLVMERLAARTPQSGAPSD